MKSQRVGVILNTNKRKYGLTEKESADIAGYKRTMNIKMELDIYLVDMYRFHCLQCIRSSLNLQLP